MPYYRGDYYRGDYYRGDPGILGSLAKGAMKAVGGFISGGPLGAAKAVLLPSQGKQLAQIPSIPAIVRTTVGPGMTMPFGQPNPVVERGPQSGGGRGGGWILTKRGWRRRGRMNPANPRALRRAIRREQAFIKLARRALKGTGVTISRRGITRKARRR